MALQIGVFNIYAAFITELKKNLQRQGLLFKFTSCLAMFWTISENPGNSSNVLHKINAFLELLRQQNTFN